VYVHDAATFGVLARWKAKYCYGPCLAWSPDGRLLARTDRSTSVRVYDTAAGREVQAVGAKRGVLYSAAFSPDGLTLATGSYNGHVRVWDVE
jgi:WD40 repeat protein